MNPEVAILFANLKGNIGDFALLHAVALDLREHFPHHAIDIYPHRILPVDRRRLEAFRASLDLPLEIAGVTYAAEPGPKLAVNAAKTLGLWPAMQARRIDALAIRSAESAVRFERYDAIVIVGGAHWSGARLGISMFATLAAVHGRNPRIYAYSFSIERAVTRYNSRQALQRYFGLIRKPLIVRDSISSETLRSLGIDNMLGADSVFGLAGLAARIAPAADRDPSRIVLALAAPRQDELRKTLKTLLGRGREIVLMTTCEPEDERSMRPLTEEFGIAYVAPDTWQAAVAEMKASALVVSNRLHGLILASLAHIPALPLTNRQKTRAFVEDTGIPFSAADVHALTVELIERCVAEREPILTAMRRYLERSSEQRRSPLSAAL